MADNIEKKTAKAGKGFVPLTAPLTHEVDIDQYPMLISLNFKTYGIKRGETVMVPPAVKKIFDEAEEAREKAYKYSLEKSLSAQDGDFKQRYNLG